MSRGNAVKMQSVVPLIGFVLLVVMANGLMAVFGFHYHNVLTLRAQDELEDMYRGVDQIREVQVHFKRQVQEWKNILLRGHNPADFAAYAASFRNEQRITQELLGDVSMPLRHWPAIAVRVVDLADKLAALNASYAEALAQYETGVDAHAVDAQVRGMDRPLETELDEVVLMLEVQVRDWRQSVRQEDDGRYQQFRRLLSITTALGCVLVLMILVVLTRRRTGD